MAKPGHYSRERDARASARKSGLKDEDFELIQGSKGWTWREKKKYVKVEGAKLHVKEMPVAPVVVNEQVQTHPNIFLEKATGRYRWQDETSQLSMESYETVDQAEKALENYCDTVLGVRQVPSKQLLSEPNAQSIPKPLPDPVPIPGLPVGLQGGNGIVEPETLRTDEPLVVPVTEKRICPECKASIDTFISGETLRYVEHCSGDLTPAEEDICNMSEEEVINTPTTGASQSSFKPHELAQIQNGDPIPAGTFSPDAVPRREVIPRVHRSTVERPSKRVWEIAEEMTKANPRVARKEVLAECVRQGIAYFTARTQYQVWLTIQKESATNQKEVNKEE